MIPVALNATIPDQHLSEIIENCKPKILVLQNICLLNKFLKYPNKIKYVILLKNQEEICADTVEDKEDNDNGYSNKLQNIKILYWDEFIKYDDKIATNNKINKTNFPQKIKKNRTATIIYKQCADGKMKGVIVTHKNIIQTIRLLLTKILINPQNIIRLQMGKERIVSYLPLDNIFTQMFDIYLPISIVAKLCFANENCLKSSLFTTLSNIQPTIFYGTPKIWDKISDIIGNKQTKLTNIISYITTIPNDNIIENIGLKKCKYRISFGAQLSDKTRIFFRDISTSLYEIYNMNEMCGLISLSLPMQNKFGSVGKPIADTKIDNGEILVKGSALFRGYFRKDKDHLDNRGYFRTGDLGYLDKDGYLFITCKKDDMITMSGGKITVQPAKLEENIKKYLPIVNHVVIVGNNKKYLIALLVLKLETSQESGSTILFTERALKILREIGSDCRTVIDAEDDIIISKYIEEGITNANRLAPNKFCHIKKWKILPTIFTTDGGELSSKLNLNRKYIAEKYKNEVDELYR